MHSHNNRQTPYDDIIRLPHHVSPTRPHMSMSDRAAQFSPFAALTGYHETVREAARYTEEKRELDEHTKSVLDRKFQMIQENIQKRPNVTIWYFLPDSHKAGGTYISTTGSVKKIDLIHRTVTLEDGTSVPLEDIADITFPP